MLVPLQEILSESLKSGVNTQKVQNEYKKLTDHFGSEFDVLLETSISDIMSISGERVSESIKKVRIGDIIVEPGYDGVFGVVKIWNDNKDNQDQVTSKEQLSIF